MAGTGMATAAMAIPIAPLNSSGWRRADQLNGGNSNMQIGWPDAVETIARIRDSSPVEERATVGILAGDKSEAGAVSLYGPAYRLPRAISGMNSNWFRGYGDPPPRTVIVLGMHRDFLGQNFNRASQLVI